MHIEEIKKIGEGGQGSAYLGKDLSTGKKVVAKRTTFFETTKRGYAREVMILRDCLPRHPNVCKLIAFSQSSKQLETIYEFCDRGSLEDYIPCKGRSPPSETFLWHVFSHLGQALAFLHNGLNLNLDKKYRNFDPVWRKPVVHRDISPDNVFLRTNKRGHSLPDVVLGDFGFATTEKETRYTMKPDFQGPEIPLITTASDIWAVGAVIHELGTGCPVVGEKPPGWTSREWSLEPKARKPLDLPSRYSDKLNDTMHMCLNPSMRKRINALELVDRLIKVSPLKIKGIL